MKRPARPAPNPSDESDKSDPPDRADRADPLATPLRPPPPPLSKRRLFILRLYLAFVLTTGLVLLSSLVDSTDRLYSHDIGFRRQTEALLDGRFALAEDAGAMAWDLAWSANGDHGAVQQVWGLGVPLLRLPFEALARVVGMPAFPDRVCLVRGGWAERQEPCPHPIPPACP